MKQLLHKVFYLSILLSLIGINGFTGMASAGDLSLTISPEDTSLFLGDTVQFSAEVTDSSGNLIDTVLIWEVVSGNIGTVDSTGFFVATEVGMAFVEVSFGDVNTSALVIVQDTTTDTTGIQIIRIIRPRLASPAPPDTLIINEGDFYKLTAFIYPMNVLNGGILHFQLGSLKEDITLKIEIPSFVEQVGGDSLSYPPDMVAAVSFDVYVNDTLISPYYFEEPVKVSIPFKRGLLTHLGISPEDIGAFFYDDSLGYDTTGITNVVVDSALNRIFADIIHFTNVVLAKTETVTGIEAGNDRFIPKNIELSQNYPNPFNPETVIKYSVPKASKVSLVVYNLLGEEVARLVDSHIASGQHRVTWNASDVSSGIYFYRLQAGNLTQTRKMLLLK